jgi:hypothetical protein
VPVTVNNEEESMENFSLEFAWINWRLFCALLLTHAQKKKPLSGLFGTKSQPVYAFRRNNPRGKRMAWRRGNINKKPRPEKSHDPKTTRVHFLPSEFFITICTNHLPSYSRIIYSKKPDAGSNFFYYRYPFSNYAHTFP